MTEIHILLVEDTPIAQLVEKTSMMQLGCKVDVAQNGFIALEQTKKKSYHLILMDIGLESGPDGFEITEQIKQQKDGKNLTTPVIAVTSYKNPDCFDRALQVGIENYFSKPFSMEDAQDVMRFIQGRMGSVLQT